MRGRRLSVPVVVATTLVAVTTLLLGSFGTGTYIRGKDRDRNQLLESAEQFADGLAVALALPVWNIDRTQIDRNIEASAGTPYVEAVVVQAAGRTQARIRNGRGELVKSDGKFPTAGLIVIERPIVFGNERLGMLRLFVTSKYIERDARSALLGTIALIVVLDILLVFFVYLVLWVAVLQPLSQIEKFAIAVTTGAERPELEFSASLTSDLENMRVTIERMVDLQESLRRSETMSAMGTLVGGVAHEIRNPLFALTALLDAYADELAAMPMTEFCDGLRQQVARLTSLTRDLLEYGRPVRISRIPGSLTALIEGTVISRSTAASDRKISVQASIDPDLPAVNMDRDRLPQAFENMLDNAIQHSPQGGTVTLSAKVTGENGQRWVEFTIEDEGPGFKPDELVHAFEPFFSRRPGGTGLGLSIVQRVIEEHQGSVAASNRGTRGAVMTVRLPV